MPQKFKSQNILEPWYFTDTSLVSQIEREMNKDHILYGIMVKTIARRKDNDDVLFEIMDAHDFKYAKVHLTWSSKVLQDSDYPLTKTYKNWQEVYEQVIVPDNKEWE